MRAREHAAPISALLRTSQLRRASKPHGVRTVLVGCCASMQAKLTRQTQLSQDCPRSPHMKHLAKSNCGAEPRHDNLRAAILVPVSVACISQFPCICTYSLTPCAPHLHFKCVVLYRFVVLCFFTSVFHVYVYMHKHRSRTLCGDRS